jgi:hypothetical protein
MAATLSLLFKKEESVPYSTSSRFRSSNMFPFDHASPNGPSPNKIFPANAHSNPKHYYITHASQSRSQQSRYQTIKQGHQNSYATTKTPACVPAHTLFFYIVLAYISSTPDPSSYAMMTRSVSCRRRVAPRLIKLSPVPNKLEYIHDHNII